MAKRRSLREVDFRDFGRYAKVGQYLITDEDAKPGRGDTYGLGDDIIDSIDTQLRLRGLVLESDHQGLVAQRIDGMTVREIARRVATLAHDDGTSDVRVIVEQALAEDPGASVESILDIVLESRAEHEAERERERD